MNYQELFECCNNLFNAEKKAEKDKITANFEMGRYLATYELRFPNDLGTTIKKLADELTAKRGRRIYAQRLYECLSIFKSFKNIEAVWELEKKVNRDLTWNFLVHNCLRTPKDETPESTCFWEKKMALLEKAGSEIEDLASRINKVPQKFKEEIKGLINTFSSISIFDEDANDLDKENTGLSGASASPATLRVPNNDNGQTDPFLSVQEQGSANDSLSKVSLPENPEKPIAKVIPLKRDSEAKGSIIGEALKRVVKMDEMTGEDLNPSERIACYISGNTEAFDNIVILSKHSKELLEENNFGQDLREKAISRMNNLLAEYMNLQVEKSAQPLKRGA